MTRILHRQIHAEFPTAVGGKGIEIVDAEGRRYIDASGGAAVSCLGHGHPRVLDAMRAQLGKLTYAHTSLYSNESAEALADLVLAVVRRTRAGRSPMAPDKQHLHHRLLEIGHSQRRAVLLIYLWAGLLAFGAVAVTLFDTAVVFWLTCTGLLLAALVSGVPRLKRQREGPSARR